MNQCKHCGSTDITYVTNYEHLDVESECSIFDNGWLCNDCECFMLDNGNWEYYASYSDPEKVNYL